MFPLFFHLESHLWIVYLLFVNGFLLSINLKRRSEQYSALTAPFEAQILAAFLLSIAINGVILLALDIANVGFDHISFILPTLSIVLVLGFASRRGFKASRHNLFEDAGWLRGLLYLCVFLVLFINGGLIDQVSDAWWHMSLANKIGIHSSFFLERGHLNGASGRYYPPLWHANLAALHLLSGKSLAVLWNAFTPWGAALKVMSFYLFAFALSGNKRTALLSAALFFILPGVGDSFMRVSSWPSHIAYTALFCLFYTVFRAFDYDGLTRESGRSLVQRMAREVQDRWTIIIAAAVLMVIILFSHQLELLWFATAMFCYFSAYLLRRCGSVPSQLHTERISEWVILAGTLSLLLLLGKSLFMVSQLEIEPDGNIDILFSYLLAIVLLIILLSSLLADFFATKDFQKKAGKTLIWLAGALLALSIDWRHLSALFNPELAYMSEQGHQFGVVAKGWFGGDLWAPGWHLQLRHGLLYSGLLSIPLSVYLMVRIPTRLTIFTAACAVTAFLFCASPYLYQWLSDISDYHSPWRIAVLIFHPIILANTVVLAWDSVRSST